MRGAGLSGAKENTARIWPQPAMTGSISRHGLPAGGRRASGTLTSVKGIGPWSAEVFLLFCAGHPDIFPAGDVALAECLYAAPSASSPPGDKAIAGSWRTRWQPCRSIAARLLWAYYAVSMSATQCLLCKTTIAKKLILFRASQSCCNPPSMKKQGNRIGQGVRLDDCSVTPVASSPGPECGLQAAELLPFVAVVLAGRDQGGVSSTGSTSSLNMNRRSPRRASR
jgi:hypothetical protein